MSRLQTHFVVLTDKLDLDKIIPYLRQDGMLTNNEYEILTNPVYKLSQRRAKLINMMLRKGKNHFEHFGNSLVWSGQTELALHIGVNVAGVPPSPYQLDVEVTHNPYDQIRQLLWNVLPDMPFPPSLIDAPTEASPPYNSQVLPVHSSTCSPPACPQQPATASAPHQTQEHTQDPTTADTSQREAGVTQIFILYCKDTTLAASHRITDAQFCDYALQMADFLEQCGGMKCSIDQYETDPQHNWNRWTQTKIKESRFVILILSPLLNKELLSGEHTCVDMKDGKFYSDTVVNSIYAPKFVPVFLCGCEPISGNLSEWIPSGLEMGRHFRLQNLAQFIEEIDPPGEYDRSPEEISQRLSAGLGEPKNENLAEFVRYLRGQQGVSRPDPPQNPVHIPSTSLPVECHRQQAHEYISKADLDTIARRINREWRHLGIKLQVDYSIIMELHDRNQSSDQQAALEMLATWQRMQGQAATRKALKKSLLALNMGRLAEDVFPNEQI